MEETASLRELVVGNLPETLKVLATAKPPLVDERFEEDDTIGRALTVTVDRLFVDTTVDQVDMMGPFVKSYVADVATRVVIIPAIDYYMVETRTSDSTAGAGIEGLGGESSQNYDRVRTLQDLDKLLAERIKAATAEFNLLTAEIRRQQIGQIYGPRVSTSILTKKTQDPEDFPAFISPRMVGSWGVWVPWPAVEEA